MIESVFQRSFMVKTYYPDRECRTKCRLRPPKEGLISTACLSCRRCAMHDEDKCNGETIPDLFQPEHGWYTPKDVTQIGCPTDQYSHFYEYRAAVCVSMQTDRTNPKYFIDTRQKLETEPQAEPCPICTMVLQERM